MFLSVYKTAESCCYPVSDSARWLVAASRHGGDLWRSQLNQTSRWKGVSQGFRLWLAALDSIYIFQIEGRGIESQRKEEKPWRPGEALQRVCVYLEFFWLHVPKNSTRFCFSQKGNSAGKKNKLQGRGPQELPGTQPKSDSICLSVCLSPLPSSVLATLWLQRRLLCVARSMDAARANLASPRMKRTPYTQSPCIPTWDRMVHQMPIKSHRPPLPSYLWPNGEA